jgi:hypothetical protein
MHRGQFRRCLQSVVETAVCLLGATRERSRDREPRKQLAGDQVTAGGQKRFDIIHQAHGRSAIP